MVRFFKSRKFRLFIACLSLFLLLDMVQSTYAKYVSSASANGSFTIANWAFLVNNQDVLSNNDFSTTISPVFPGTTHIKNGVISPTSTGYFDITIDATDVEVSFDEEITLSLGSTNTVTDLVFDSYSLNNGTAVTLTGASPTITTTHLLSDTQRVNTYRFYVTWFDGQGEDMDNADDTDAAVNGVANVEVSVRFIQRVS